MSKRIPKSIQEKAVAKWLEGKTRDQIARELKISGGSVSAIIKGRRRKDREFDLLRVVAVELRERNTDVESFSLFIRLRELLKSQYSDSSKSIEEVEEESIDSMMECLIVFCFIRKMSIQEFGTRVQSLYHAADQVRSSTT
jgi:DNA-binding CsgD family transcriptional regulator